MTSSWLGVQDATSRFFFLLTCNNIINSISSLPPASLQRSYYHYHLYYLQYHQACYSFLPSSSSKSLGYPVSRRRKQHHLQSNTKTNSTSCRISTLGSYLYPWRRPPCPPKHRPCLQPRDLGDHSVAQDPMPSPTIRSYAHWSPGLQKGHTVIPGVVQPACKTTEFRKSQGSLVRRSLRRSLS